VLMLNTPAILPDSQTRDALLAIDSIRAVIDRFRNVRVALVGVGTLENSVFIERGVLAPPEIARLRKAGAVGEICGRFFNADGVECNTRHRNRVVSISMADLQRTDLVIAVVAGSDRSDAILAAVRGGLLKALVIDSGGAAALLRACE
jgi:deoxyribonucleoside regulator